MLIASVWTELVNTVLQWIGYYFGKLVNVLIAAFMQVAQWLGQYVASFAIGIIANMVSAIPGVTADDGMAAATFARGELEKWNHLFPVYESLSCLTVILTFRLAIGAYRAYHTAVWHASNLHNSLPKIAGTG